MSFHERSVRNCDFSYDRTSWKREAAPRCITVVAREDLGTGPHATSLAEILGFSEFSERFRWCFRVFRALSVVFKEVYRALSVMLLGVGPFSMVFLCSYFKTFEIFHHVFTKVIRT